MSLARSRFLARSCNLAVVLSLAAALAGSASAQPPEGNQEGRRRGGFFGGGPGGPGGGGAGELGLLVNEQVQKELELIDDQINEFKQLREANDAKMRETFGNLRDLPEEERRKKFEELRGTMETSQKELREKIGEILLPHQRDRLKEIGLQMRGAGALEDPEVAEKLKITDDQKKQLADIREKQREQMREVFSNRGEGNQAGGMERFQALRRENEEKVMAVLTDEQKAEFEKLKGEKFEIDMSQFRRGPGGPGGPGGGAGGFRGRRPEGDRPEGAAPREGDET